MAYRKIRRQPVSGDIGPTEDADKLIFQTDLLLNHKPGPSMPTPRKNQSPHRSKGKDLPGLFRSIASPTHRLTNMNIGDRLTTFRMVPQWFQPIDSDAIRRETIYPRNVKDKRPYDAVARYRATVGLATDFVRQPLQVSERSSEILIVSLDTFAQQYGGEVSFTNDDLTFNDSVEQISSGIANMGSVHLLANDRIPTASVDFLVDIDYQNDLARAPETMQNFVLNFSVAIAHDLGCSRDFVRALSVEKSADGSSTSRVRMGVTTPDLTETKKYAELLQTHAKGKWKDNQLLRRIIPMQYDLKWQYVLSYLHLRAKDFDPRYNIDYVPGLPTPLRRGNQPYNLPIGWYRHGLNMNGKYPGDDLWLGQSNVEGEWPVAFHGTHCMAAEGIINQGLCPGKAKTDFMQDEAIQQIGNAAKGPGLYLATHCDGGSHPTYTKSFQVTHDGKTEAYCLVFQCRVRPKSYSVHTTCVKMGHGWRVVDPTAIRPYGLLLKKQTDCNFQSPRNSDLFFRSCH